MWSIQGTDRSQGFSSPASIEDDVSAEHLVRAIETFVRARLFGMLGFIARIFPMLPIIPILPAHLGGKPA